MKSFVHQRYVTTTLADRFISPPVNTDPYGGYVRPARGGRILMGCETLDREEYRVTSTEFEMSQLTTPSRVRTDCCQRFADFVPALADANWESERVGLLSFSVDGEPVLGPVPQLPGLFVAGSFHSGGFSYNPVAGLFLAEYVVDGRTSLDISAFAPQRFLDKPADIERHLARTVTQRHTVTTWVRRRGS